MDHAPLSPSESTLAVVRAISVPFLAYNDLRRRVRRTVTFEACLPRKAKELPSGSAWIYEIKHDGFRILAHKDADPVRLITRNGYDFADRYPLIVNAIKRLPVETCIIDGEAIVVDQNGLSVFDLLRYRGHDHVATLCAFDVLEVDGAELRRKPIEERKQHLSRALRTSHHGIALNATYNSDGPIVYEHACALGCEGVVSKQLCWPYFSGRTDKWLKMKKTQVCHSPSWSWSRSSSWLCSSSLLLHPASENPLLAALITGSGSRNQQRLQ